MSRIPWGGGWFSVVGSPSANAAGEELHVSKESPPPVPETPPRQPPEHVLRALGIDFGERRIGLALSDPEGRLATPWGVVVRETDRRAVHRIASLARDEAVARLVVGEPHDLEGRTGEAAERVRRFGGKLERVTGLPITYVDEALTTVEATARLTEAGLDRRDDPERRDAVAAQILLQELLDRESAERGCPSPEAPGTVEGNQR